ncbi:hypothetical protein [Pedobacter panaciterrae]
MTTTNSGLVKQQQNQIQQFNFFDADQFAVMQRVSQMFSNSELVPDMYRATPTNPKEKAIANCMIAIETAQRIGASPLMVMQNMYIVYGKPSWSAKFLTATVNACGRFNSIKYKMELLGKIKHTSGQEIENWECIAYTTEKGSDHVMESIPVSIEMAIAEGWYDKKGSKWKTMPKLMLQYRSVTYWTSAYAPELSMGIKTTEEIFDIEDAVYVDVTNQKASDNVQSTIDQNANTKTVDFGDKEPEAADENKSAIQPSEKFDKRDDKKEDSPEVKMNF